MKKTYNRSKANLGKQLERLLDMTNLQYRNKGIADIRKVPTPVQITGNNRGKITGYTQNGEWVDYVGVFDGRTIAFDAKETNSNTSFPLKNVSDHQYELLESWHEKGAATFLLVSFTKKHEEIYMLPFSHLRIAWNGYKGDGRKSIPYAHFQTNCDIVRSEGGYVLHYLKHIGRKEVRDD